MAEQSEISLGEIYRMLLDLKQGFKDHQKEMREDRVELREQLREARNEVREALAPIAILETTVGEHAEKLKALIPKVDTTTKDTAVNAAVISIGISLIIAIANLLMSGKLGH